MIASRYWWSHCWLTLGTVQAFISPATKKTLQPASLDRDASVGMFPLWTRKEGFGVITIFKGSAKTLFIENDRIPLGSTAFFEGKPDLNIVEYKRNKPSGSSGSENQIGKLGFF
jgi:hypothetical protein